MSRNLYGIMIKYPEPGRVKTRLAEGIGDQRAAEIYRQIVEMIMSKTEPHDQKYERIVLYDPPERLPDFRQWLPGNHLLLQQGADVGKRMHNATIDLFDRGADRAVLTGADIPALDSGIISCAFDALDHADIVIGPAADGGYYLIGMKRPHKELFEGIAWSTETVYEQTTGKISKMRLTFVCTAMLSDIDRAEDLRNHPCIP